MYLSSQFASAPVTLLSRRFEIFECGRKMALVALPIFLPADSPESVYAALNVT